MRTYHVYPAQACSSIISLLFVLLCYRYDIFLKLVIPPFTQKAWLHKEIFKVVFLGDGAVGKSEYYRRIVYNDYVDGNYNPTILDTYNIEFPEFKKGSQLEIIDTSGSGQESYDYLADQDICKAEAVLLFYSIASDSSFRKISDYYARVQSLAYNPVVMLIGTKCDVDEREVPLERGRRLAREMGVYFQEVSAKKSKNTERVLSDLKRLLFWRRPCPRHRTPLNSHL